MLPQLLPSTLLLGLSPVSHSMNGQVCRGLVLGGCKLLAIVYEVGS